MSYASNGSELIQKNGNSSLEPRPTFFENQPSVSRRARKNTRKVRPEQAASSPIIVHSHLCWDWVWQRPQQFISRFSSRHRILFVETIGPDPQLSSALARFYTPDGFPNITVLRLQFPAWRWDDGAFVDRERRRLVKEFIGGPAAGKFDEPIQWFYDPMAVSAFAGQMNESLTIYDCMDELSQFRGAPPAIKTREAELLARADLVFTGGRKLYEAKRLANDNCHFYGCGVDADHFGKARQPGTSIPADLAALRKPALGYFGVVDERLDYGLIARLADARPDWSVVIVGPVLKVEASILPQRPNLHWLGRRPYEDLPAYCKGFDVCLMPFALNEATEYINPTKALEYMATGREIVGSAVPDVVRNFGSVVKVASDHEEFVQFCRHAVEAHDREAVARGLEMAAGNSWESIVSEMERHIEEALAKKYVNGPMA